MVNNTVNGKKIGKAAGENDKIKFNYYACGKNEKGKMDAKENEKRPSISIIESLRENGQIIEETSKYVSIKAYPGGNPNKNRNSNDNKEKHNEDITH